MVLCSNLQFAKIALAAEWRAVCGGAEQIQRYWLGDNYGSKGEGVGSGGDGDGKK